MRVIYENNQNEEKKIVNLAQTCATWTKDKNLRSALDAECYGTHLKDAALRRHIMNLMMEYSFTEVKKVLDQITFANQDIA